jgi:hypothetical protein
MKVISNTIKGYINYYQSKCEHFKNSVCCKERCDCRIQADVWAHVTIIPDHLREISLQDFTGMYQGQRLLSQEIVCKARENIIKYCWQGIEEGVDYEFNEWFPKSIMDKRLANGSSLVIYGDPWTHDNSKGQIKTFKKPLGKSMVAAIVMREAIAQRIKVGHACDSYEWVDYNTLRKRLMGQAKGETEHDDAIAFYEEADWLVVDGLQRKHDASRQFSANVLDDLFCERVENNKPNILVFQDDISKIDDLTEDFGISISNIVNSRKTHHVVLK